MLKESKSDKLEKYKYRAFVVEDEPSMGLAIKKYLEKAGYQCKVYCDGQEALKALPNETPHIILSDLKMPGMSGMEFLEKVVADLPDVPVIIITGYATIDTAVEAMKRGASDFLAKPFSPDELLLKVEKALERVRLIEENAYLRRITDGHIDKGTIVGRSEGIQNVLETVDKISFSDSRVLITGESGTGKELVARAIYYSSPRGERAFYPVNCAAFVESLLESELFGHEKGAFTGAVSVKKGFFEVANYGTLFLDEIGDTSLSFQAKLLRVVQEGEFIRVGGTRIQRSDVRIISSSNKDLKIAINEGKFREDLYYRLSVVHISLPPLRERRDDIPLLAEYLLAKHACRMKKKVKGFTPDVMTLLTNYHWPGNIRELENVIERAVIMTAPNENISEKDLPMDLSSKKAVLKGGTLEDMEKELIRRALDECKGNRTLAARRLGIGRGTLYEKTAKYGISLPRPR